MTATHALSAPNKLGHHLFKTEQAVEAQVTFTFVGGPPLAIDDGLVVNETRKASVAHCAT